MKTPISVTTSPVIVYKAPFTISSYAFHMQEWSNRARDNVLRLYKTVPLVSFFGWLAKNTLTLKMTTTVFAEMSEHFMQPVSKSYT
jgi:hypothetical protein